MVKLLLQDERVDPSDVENLAIKEATENGHKEVVKLLLQDKRVRDKLPKEEFKTLQKWITRRSGK